MICSGRTDSGVHACSQVCHFDTYAIRDPYNWVMGVNSQLPDDISVAWASEVDPEFHARFRALSRQYVYLIKCSSSRSALLKKSVTLTHKKLDPQLMAVAAQSLIGTYDFNAFRSAQCQAKTSVRSVTRLSVHHHDQLIALHVEANGFLQHMVRNIVGVLMAIGAKEQPTWWVEHVLASKERTEGGVTASSHGLYFLGPTYCNSYNLPVPSEFRRLQRHLANRSVRVLMTRVKFCGLTHRDDVAEAVVQTHLDLYSMSRFPRKLREGVRINAIVPAFITRVGLFVDADAALARGIFHHAGLNLVQYHGNESSEFCDSRVYHTQGISCASWYQYPD